MTEIVRSIDRSSRIAFAGLVAGSLLMGATVPVSADTLVVVPSKDNTMFAEDPEKSNGLGVHLFVGNTAVAAPRRALVRFDLSGIPVGSVVTAAQLRITVNRSVGAANPATLHRLNADWGEGASDAGFGRDGGGTQAEPGDVTWDVRFYPGSPWTASGGDFAASASASVLISGDGTYTWGSTAGMVSDVQAWVSTPASNHGWLIRGDESVPRTAKRFFSKQGSIVTAPADLPTLTVTFTPPPPAANARPVPLPAWAVAVLGLSCAGVFLRGRARLHGLRRR